MAKKKTLHKKATPKRQNSSQKSKKLARLNLKRIRNEGVEEAPTYVIDPKKPIANPFKLFYRSLKVLKEHWQLFFSITFIYAVLNLVLVRGLSGGADLTNLKNNYEQLLHGHGSQIGSAATLFLYILGGNGNNASNNLGGAYEGFIIVIVSLAMVYALRQIYNKKSLLARDGFYQGMYPLVPVLIVLIVVGLDLIPLVIGGLLYALMIGGQIAITPLEEVLVGIVSFGLVLLSFYRISSSIFALYIASLPNMTPLRALRSARQLTKKRHIKIFGRLIFLPIALIVVAGVIIVPIIAWASPIATWSFFALTMIGLSVTHSYLYALYRELL